MVLHEDPAIIQQCQESISQWLKGIGLELNLNKTRIGHTLIQYGDKVAGFEFLGFNIRQYRVGKHQSGKLNGTLLGFKTIITPSNRKQKAHYDQMARIVDAHKTAPQSALIRHLNPVIRGWANYYSRVVSKATYSRLDHQMYQKLAAWAKHRHPGKAWEWVCQKYWHAIGGDCWCFAKESNGNWERLQKHKHTAIVRHVKVHGNASIYDGNWVYWSSRMGKHPEIPQRVAALLKRQQGKCAHCGLFFRDEDLLEMDHIIPKSKKGRDGGQNIQLLHRHCHDVKTANDRAAGVHDKHQITEEPDAGNLASPVLKPSREGDFPA